MYHDFLKSISYWWTLVLPEACYSGNAAMATLYLCSSVCVHASAVVTYPMWWTRELIIPELLSRGFIPLTPTNSRDTCLLGLCLGLRVPACNGKVVT